MATPRLPPELERVIFELAAEHLTDIHRLVLVCWRVKEWVEPLLYRTIVVCKETVPDIPQTSLRALVSCLELKDPAFLAHATRNLLISDALGDDVLRITSFFPNLDNLYLECSAGQLAPLPRLTKLHCPLIELIRRGPAPLGEDFATHSMFANITHLELFDHPFPTRMRPVPPEVHPGWTALSQLPQLTHLAVMEFEDSQIYVHILHVCRARLRILVVSILHSFNHPTRHPLDALPPLHPGLAEDPRFVVMSLRHFYEDWQRGALAAGRANFWTRADELAETRRAKPGDRNAFFLDLRGPG
ncbi:hypothetical protein MKEN_00988900 [Mycena kentingensis (nom. inval.)]|nr:hypothetical protein MKEN_00988900 [Mycena kentingensis (nom. inval.)]